VPRGVPFSDVVPRVGWRGFKMRARTAEAMAPAVPAGSDKPRRSKVLTLAAPSAAAASRCGALGGGRHRFHSSGPCLNRSPSQETRYPRTLLRGSGVWRHSVRTACEVRVGIFCLRPEPILVSRGKNHPDTEFYRPRILACADSCRVNRAYGRRPSEG